MESQEIINSIFVACTAGIGWFCKEIWEATKSTRSDISKLREELPKIYVIKEDYRADINEIKHMLDRIFDRLEDKVNKIDK